MPFRISFKHTLFACTALAAALLASCSGSTHARSQTPAAIPLANSPAPDSAANTVATNPYLTTSTPYQPQQKRSTYEAPPAGFTPVYTQAIVRHGSRGLPRFDASLYNMWRQAASDNALTPLGQQLGPDLLRVIRANALLNYGVPSISAPGYGGLSQLGINEQTGIAARLAQRLSGYFAQVAATAGTRNPRQIIVSSSGVGRAIDSSTAFSHSLTHSVAGLSPLVTLSAPLTAYPANEPVTQAAGVNRFLLYFHKLSPKTDLVSSSSDPYSATYNDSVAYQNYLNHNANRLAKINALITSQDALNNAHAILDALFTQDFIAKLDNGAYRFANSGGFTFTSDDGKYTQTVSGDNSVGIASSTDAVSKLYSFYSVAPGMRVELNHRDFSKYIPAQQAAELAYLDDVQTFYEKGPGIAEDRPATYQMAQALLDDMFNEVDAIAKGNLAHAAKLRFAHAEITIPMTAILGLKDIDVPVPNADNYTYADNPWRGNADAPYASNIQWDVYSNGQGTLLVKMLFNEKEVDFKAACDSARYAMGSAFYDYSKLQACYGHRAS
jgi:hypothetical protein